MEGSWGFAVRILRDCEGGVRWVRGCMVVSDEAVRVGLWGLFWWGMVVGWFVPEGGEAVLRFWIALDCIGLRNLETFSNYTTPVRRKTKLSHYHPIRLL